MKHVFVINSHTTFLTAMGTVELLKTKIEEVIFIYIRNYNYGVSHIPFTVVDGTNIADECKNIGLDYTEYIRKVDAFIDKNINERYDLFVPHFWHYFFQLLYTNKKCRRVSFVQEGGPVQAKVYETNTSTLERIKFFIRHVIFGRRTFECKWYKKGTLYKQCKIDSYAINNKYFQYLPSNNHIVKWPTQQLDLTIERQRPIFIFDGHISNGLVEPDVYMQVCRKIIKIYAKEKNYVKFHPGQSKGERKKILSIFYKNHKTAEIIDDGIPMEYVIIQFKTLTFIGFSSSLLYYAYDYEHNVICCEKLLTHMSRTYRKHVETSGFKSFFETYGEYEQSVEITQILGNQ